MHWNIIVIVATAVLLVLVLWKEYRRTNRQRLAWRLVSSALAVLSLACMALPLTYTRPALHQEDEELVIVTKGYTSNSLPQKSVTTDPTLAKHGVLLIPDIAQYLAAHPEYQRLRVAGYGLPLYELERLSAYPIDFEMPPLPAGLNMVQWSQYLRSNKNLAVNGVYNNTSSKPVQLTLVGLGAVLDSTTIDLGRQPFALQTLPKQLGKAVFQLIAVSGTDTLANESLPVEVFSSDAVRVLILAGAPDFENRFVADWLYEQHYTVAVKNSISTGKTGTQLSNAQDISLTAINSNLLSRFDVVIVDDESINRLAGTERNALQAAIENGLGLIIKTGSASNASFAAKAFRVYQQPGHTLKAYPLHLQTGSKTASLSSDEWAYISPQEDDQPLVTDDHQKILVDSKLYGAGRLVVSTLHNTYSWKLSGNTSDYTAYWSLLLSKAAKPLQDSVSWQISPQLAIVDQPVTIILQTTGNILPAIETADGDVYLQQDLYLPTQWTGTYWPRQQGWQTIRTGKDSLNLFVYDQAAWSAVRSAQLIQDQQRFQQEQPMHSNTTAHTPAIEKREIPKFYFFILFVICCGFLWLEAKWL